MTEELDVSQTQGRAKSKKRMSFGRIGVLLVGIFIVGTLLYPRGCIIPILPRTTNPRALNSAHNLKSAVSAYFKDYLKYPIEVPAKNGDTDLESNHRLMDVLLGSAPEADPGGLNPRRITYFSGRQARPAEGGGFRRGVTYNSEDGTGELWDPWANFYRVRMDTDSDNRVESPEPGAASIPEAILVWSAGPDGDFDTWKDNVKTW